MFISSDSVTRDESIVAQMDQISKEVAHRTPLVSEPEPLGNLKNEYLQDDKFLAKIEVRFNFNDFLIYTVGHVRDKLFFFILTEVQ